MNPQRRRRLWLVLALVLAGGLATTLVAMALQRNVAYLYTPSEVLRGDAGAHSRFRLGGMVEKARSNAPPVRGSAIPRHRWRCAIARQLRPHPAGPVSRGQAVVATGRMQNGIFVAEDVLAKHDETYMPKEVADKMGSAHRKHDVPTAAGQAGELH